MLALELNISPLRFAAAKACSAVFGNRAYYKGPCRTVRLVDIPEPSLPDDDWVKIKVSFCGFCGSDLNLITLKDSPSAEPFASFPCIIGHEFVGRITEKGGSIHRFDVGDKVAVNPAIGCEVKGITPICPACRAGRPGNCANQAVGRFSPGMFIGLTRHLNGGFAPYVVVHKSQLFHIPERLDLKSAVMVEPLSVALQAVLDNPPVSGETILVIGGGVIGNLIVQCVRIVAQGCRIVVAEPSSFAAKLAKELGADEVVRPHEILDTAVAVTGAKRYDPTLGAPILRGGFSRVYDTVGNSATLNIALRVTAELGAVSLVGIGKTVRVDPTPLWLKLLTIKGAYGYGTASWQGTRRQAFETAMELMEENRIETDRLITHTFRIEEYQKMLRVNMNKAKHRAIKTVVTFEGL